MLMQNFLSQKKTRAKINRQKIFDYLVRVHNDKRLELCGREGIKLQLQDESFGLYGSLE